ncbi:hypothetical protein ABIE78_002787 [Sinorhizobium fredii]|uniref:DNA polymerase LigD ligase region n=1 Tax=Sinorhizobium fredii (strain USDA 257) TaxID=1185652 RepID=I3X681_SINF2|nr:DNA polymerase LigD ligase region [Sinorhizobium fredii USDA 257]
MAIGWRFISNLTGSASSHGVGTTGGTAFRQSSPRRRQLPLTTAILDSEPVILDKQGRSDFGMLQRALGRRPSAHEPGEIILFAFDLLYLNGRDLRRLPQRERRCKLEPLVAGREGAIRLSEQVEADGDEFLTRSLSRIFPNGATFYASADAAVTSTGACHAASAKAREFFASKGECDARSVKTGTAKRRS